MPLRCFPPLASHICLARHQKYGGREKKTSQTFENDGILGTPKVAKRLQGPVGHDIYEFRSISENIELVGIPKILGRVNFDAVLVRLWRCREFCIEVRIFPESQTFLLVLETAEVP